jgi:spore germination protein YaaH
MTRAPGRPRRRRWPLGAAVVVTVSVALAGLALAVVLPRGEPAGPGGSPPGAGVPKRIGYVPYWDQRAGFRVVEQHPDLFDEVSPVWYSLEPTGEIVLTDPENTVTDRRMVRFLQARGVKVIPTVTNLRNGDWDPAAVQEMLHDPAAMRTHIRELVELAAGRGYDGIDIDYEHLRAVDREPFSAFLTELGAALRAGGKVLTAAVHPKTDDAGDDPRNLAQDYRAIGAAVDQVRVMTYDYSWEDSPPGPVAPAGWVEEVIAWAVTQIPADRVILGIVLLGYDWAGGQGTTVDFRQAQAAARAHSATVRRASDGSPWFVYQGRAGTPHEVWYEDATSAPVKLELVSRYRLGGAFFWHLGGADPQLWPAIRDPA